MKPASRSRTAKLTHSRTVRESAITEAPSETRSDLLNIGNGKGNGLGLGLGRPDGNNERP